MKTKKEFQVLYKHPNFGKIGPYILIYVITAFIIFLLPLFLTPTMNISLYFVYLALVIIFLPMFFIMYAYTHSYWHDITKYYLENIPNEINFNNNKEYAL